MSTTADYVGRTCPFCGAVDSLDTDDARGEVACTECAVVVAMGLEESMSTRFEKDATYQDVDRRADRMDDGKQTRQGQGAMEASVAGSSNLSAAGAGNRPLPSLHPKMLRYFDYLSQLSKRGEEVVKGATRLTQQYVQYCRDRGIKADSMNATCAASFLIASENCGDPMPTEELHEIDPDLKRAELRRKEIVTALGLGKEEAVRRERFASLLTRRYLRLLGLPLVSFEAPALLLAEAIQHVTKSIHFHHPILSSLVESDRVCMAVLLAATDDSITWEGKPDMAATALFQHAALNPASPTSPQGRRVDVRAVIVADFASHAHLNPKRVARALTIDATCMKDIVGCFNDLMAKKQPGPVAGSVTVGVKRERDE